MARNFVLFNKSHTRELLEALGIKNTDTLTCFICGLQLTYENIGFISKGKGGKPVFACDRFGCSTIAAFEWLEDD